jgi:uncharacterized phage-like protein YoqJ
MRKGLTCCFTGHRANKLPWGQNEDDPRCIELKARIANAAEAVYSSGVCHFICGMATGCDMYFCEAVISLRSVRENVTIEAAIPWEGQAEHWSGAQRDRYFRLLSECDYRTVLQTGYTPDCMMKRNRYMVDSSSVLIAAYGGTAGGTMNTMLYAGRKGLEIIEISI